MKTRFLILILIVIVSVSTFVSCKREVKYQGDPIVTNLEVKNIVDHKLVMDNYEGKIVVVNFFASWCPPCKDEAPAFLRIYNRYKDKNFVIIGYSIDDRKSDAMNFVNNFGWEFPVYLASEELQRKFRVSKVPETFIYDKEGNLIEMVPGMVSERYLEIFAKMGEDD